MPKEKSSLRSRSYSSAKRELLNDRRWNAILLSCLERRIPPVTVAEYLSRKFRWADKAKIFNAISEEKPSLESIKKKVGPLQYIKYLDEVFTQILAMSPKDQEYLPKTITTTSQVHNKVVVAMLLEDQYDQIHQNLDF